MRLVFVGERRVADPARSQYSGWCRSAKPPSISARTKFIVIAERACALIMRRGSGMRASAVNSGCVDDVAAVARQRHAVARFGVGRTRLGVLAGEAADAHHRQAQAVHQHQAHLQQHLEPVGDHVRIAVGETLGAVAALQQEALAFLRLGQLLLEREDFPRRHQRRQRAQFAQRRLPARPHPDTSASASPDARASWRAPSRREGSRDAACDRDSPWTTPKCCSASSHHGAGDAVARNRAGRTPFSGGGMRRQRDPGRQQHEPEQAPRRHRQAEEGPVDLGAFARTGEHLADDVGEAGMASSMKSSGGPQAGTWSGGRCCSHTWRPAMPMPDAARGSARARRTTRRPAVPRGAMQAADQEHQAERGERDALEDAQRARVRDATCCCE